MSRYKTGGFVPTNDERFEKVYKGTLKCHEYVGHWYFGCNVLPSPIREKRLFKYKGISFEMFLN